MADDEVQPLGTLTTNYGWTKPTVGGDVDAWGGMINTDLDGIDSTVKSISTVANAAYPASNPSGYQTAAQVTAVVPIASSTTPVMDGTAAVGTGTTWARADHVHPSDTTLLPKAGGTVTGNLSVTGTLSANSGVCNISIANGGTNPTIQLLNAAQAAQSAWIYNASAGQVTLNNVSTGAVFNLAQDITAAPLSGHNFIVSPGQGFQAGGGSWGTLSDARIKTVESDYGLGLDEVLQLRPVVYRYKGNATLTEHDETPTLQSTEKAFVGLIAQEVETVMPGMVTQSVGFIDGEPVADLRNLNNSELVYALVNAVKTLTARVAELEAARG